ncbi:hypothetical protein DL89DRAFT_270511 [Linderina pennispora]|uniref:UAS domain-containing protein n=1 Tax=Linderina pennispora TaxID=61395 RepID=A0A1Y1VXP3_9FUNG|nr:uncharacterized protein DL89DRAFT_270511 [Linderina pennispora]ORX65963.1 hypothetical protein DL89DRAFT_270511 [Linderina pennispora]
MDDLVQNFCAVTGAEADVATGYLQVSDNNVEQAVSLYFENGGRPLQSHTSAPAASGPGSSEGLGSFAGGGEDSVRAPIAAQRDVLVADYGGGSYQSYGYARSSGGDGKWLLLNIQDVADFRCQALNRDIWKDELIKDIVAKNFVFLQIAVDTSEGGRLASLYNTQGEFPFIAIIDPKTGECQRVLSRFSRPNDFMDDVMSFLASSPAGAAGSSAAARATGGMRSSTRPVHEMTEEEQLAAAIAASELETHHEGTQDDPIDIVDSDDDFDSSSYSLPDADDMEVEDTSPSPVRLSAPQPAVDLGPDACHRFGPTVTRIQFRLPNGSRVSDKVLVLFQYLKASVAEAQSEVPEVLFMRSRLAKLVNASVTVDI